MKKMTLTERWLVLGRALVDAHLETTDPEERVILSRVFRRAGLEPPAVMPIEEFDEMMNTPRVAPCPFIECLENS